MYSENTTTISTSQYAQAAIDCLTTTHIHNDFGQIRTITRDGEPWFVAKDIAAILGYINTNDAISKHCKGVANHYPLQTSGGKQNVRIIAEPDLYRLIAKSELPAAERFESWIFEDVLPTIRKHGMYATQNFVESALADPDTMIRTLLELKETRRQRDHAIATKALISRKREATAMNTASQLSKENSRLREQVGDSKTWKQARAIPWLEEFFSLNKVAYAQIGRRFTKESQSLGIEPRTIDHSKWGTVKTYHSDVIAHFKHKLIEDRNLMRKYRKY